MATGPNDHFHLRRAILETLYTIFKGHPYQAVELRQVENECRTTPEELNWNIVYLEKCGYVELAKSPDSAPYVAPSVTLTAAGIDLIENKKRFNQQFPQ